MNVINNENLDNEKDINFKVPLTVIKEIKPHPKPDVHSLEIAVVYGWEVVVKKGFYKVGDIVYYVPPNSLLSQKLEDYLFPPSSKIKLDKHRIKAIKIQGFVSQGMLILPTDVDNALGTSFIRILETDYADSLGITKYQSPAFLKVHVKGQPGSPRNKKDENPYFHKYGGLNNIKWYPDLFEKDELVYVSEKLHGTNFRAGWTPFIPKTKWGKFWNKIKSFFGKRQEWEFVYGSNNVQLQNKEKNHKGYYDKNYYLEAVEKYDLRNKLSFGQIIYGEIYGANIQKGYDYGLKNSRALAIFDMKLCSHNVPTEWVSHRALHAWCAENNIPTVPVLYQGPYNKEFIESLVSGPSKLNPEQKVREGIVIKNIENYINNRKALKWINPAYTMKEAQNETTDFQ